MADFTYEDLKCVECPICLTIPEDKVFQCKNGHLLCHKCYPKVPSCPQCRVCLAKRPIRNLAVEFLLDAKVFPCKFQDVGCLKMMKRKEKLDHAKGCKFEFRLTNLCQSLGYTCNHKINFMQRFEVESHFLLTHAIVPKENFCNLILKNFMKITGTFNLIWKPIILTVDSFVHQQRFLITLQLDKSDKGLWLGCRLLEDPFEHFATHYKIAFTVTGKSSKVPNIEWNLNPRAFEWAAKTNYLITRPLFKIPIRQLKLYYLVDGCVSMTVKVISGDEPFEMKPDVTRRQPIVLYPLQHFTDHPQMSNLNWKCKECELEIPEEIGYFCLQCPFLVLCKKCLKDMKHSYHMFAMMRGPKQQKYMEIVGTNNEHEWQNLLPDENSENVDYGESEAFSKECGNCGGSLFGTTFYTCLLCPARIDFCEGCVAQNVHRHHILGVIVTSRHRQFSSLRKEGFPLVPLLATKVTLC